MLKYVFGLAVVYLAWSTYKIVIELIDQAKRLASRLRPGPPFP